MNIVPVHVSIYKWKLRPACNKCIQLFINAHVVAYVSNYLKQKMVGWKGYDPIFI